MPRGQKNFQDTELLKAALEGLVAQKQRIEEQIKQVQSMLGGRKRVGAAKESSPAPAQPKRKRRLSAAARQRIAAAQKRRWAEYRKNQTKE
jgi:hypothetical protein